MKQIQTFSILSFLAVNTVAQVTQQWVRSLEKATELNFAVLMRPFISSLNFLGLLLLTTGLAHAQYSLIWQEPMTGSFISNIASDIQDNVVVSGNLWGNGSVVLGNMNLSNASNDAGFVAKMDANNNWLWAKKITHTGTEGSSEVIGVTTDSSGNIFITGWFWGTIKFDNITLSNAGGGKNGKPTNKGKPTTTSTSQYDLFVAKMDPSGNFLWAAQDGTTAGADAGLAVAADQSGNVYVTGYFTQKTLTSKGSYAGTITDIYVAKFGPTGTKLWAKSYANEATKAGDLYGTSGDLKGLDVATDASGNAFVAGTYNKTVAFGNGQSLTASTKSAFTLKLDPNGVAQWAAAAQSNHVDVATSVIVDGSGDVYTGGIYKGSSLTFGDTVLSGGEQFVAKYTNSGSLLWAVNLIDFPLSGGWDFQPVDLFIHQNDYIGAVRTDYGIAVVSQVDGSLVFYNEFDGFDTTGWASAYKGAGTSTGFVFSGDGYGTVDVGNLTITINTEWGDNFICRYETQSAKRNPPSAPVEATRVMVFPNPATTSIHLSVDGDRELGRVQMFDMSGALILEQIVEKSDTDVSIENFRSGVYIINLPDHRQSVRVIKQ